MRSYSESLVRSMLSALDSFQGRRILVIGDWCRDEEIALNPKQHQEGKFPCGEVNASRTSYGMAGAVCNFLVALGAEATYVVQPAIAFSIKTRYYFSSHLTPYFRVDNDYRKPLSRDESANICRFIDGQIPSVSAAVLSDYDKRICTPEVCQHLIQTATTHKVPVLVDPCIKGGFEKYAGASLIKGNRFEVHGDCPTPLVITKGHLGMTYFETPYESRHYDTADVSDGDPCGCGDLVTAILALALATGVHHNIACPLANIAAGLKCHKRGAMPVPVEELRHALTALLPQPLPAESR